MILLYLRSLSLSLSLMLISRRKRFRTLYIHMKGFFSEETIMDEVGS